MWHSLVSPGDTGSAAVVNHAVGRLNVEHGQHTPLNISSAFTKINLIRMIQSS